MKKRTYDKNLTFVNFIVPLHVLPARALVGLADLEGEDRMESLLEENGI